MIAAKIFKLFKKNWHNFYLRLAVFFILIDLFLLGFFLYLKIPNSSSPAFLIANAKTYPEIQKLQGKNLSFKDLANFFTDLANKKGAVYAYQVLKLAPIPPNIDMHLLGHLVGDILYKQKGVDGIKYCTDDFRNACSHSIVVALFLKNGTKALSQIADACKKAPGGKGAYAMCYHGLGHGVLAYVDYDLEKAVSLCQKIETNTSRSREYVECIGGAIMEMMSGVNNHQAWEKQVPKYFSTSDPLMPCSASFIPFEAKPICYIYLTPHLFQEAGANLQNPQPQYFTKAFSFCSAIPSSEEINRRSCAEGFGKEFVVLAKDRDIRNIGAMKNSELQRVYSWCNLATNKDFIAACIRSAVNSLYWGGENKPAAAINFCKLVNGDLQSVCFNNLITAVGYYINDPNYLKGFCGSLPENIKTSCKKHLL